MAFAKHSNGRLFRIFTESPVRIGYLHEMRCVTAVGTMERGISPCGGHNKKTAAPIRMLQPFFRNKNYQKPYLQLWYDSLLSSSPDLRIFSSVRPSRISPMTGFRLAQSLHAYSGGTVRDFHPVFYSPARLLPPPQALKGSIYFAL